MRNIEKLDLDIIELDEISYSLIERFTSGDEAFDNYLLENASCDKNNGDGVTYIIVNYTDGKVVEPIAYYTLSAFTVNIVDRYDFQDDDIPEEDKREHFSPIPSIMIKMFAVSEDYQDTIYDGKLVSSIILKGIIDDIKNISNNVIGAKMITLCSVDTAIKFYKENGFISMADNLTLFDFVDAIDNHPMYMPLYPITINGSKIKKDVS